MVMDLEFNIAFSSPVVSYEYIDIFKQDGADLQRLPYRVLQFLNFERLANESPTSNYTH
jgi:hypothetical protein